MNSAAPTRTSASSTTPSFTLLDDAHLLHLSKSVWLREVWTRGLPVLLDDDWFVESATELRPSLPDNARVLHHTAAERWGSVALELSDCLALVTLGRGSLSVTVCGPSHDEAEACLNSIRQRFPESEAPIEQVVPITFWHYSDSGPTSARRDIEVPDWGEIVANYAETPTRRDLGPLMRGFRPSSGGRILLWHGEPGTGKTYAIRALAWEWRDWADLHYVVDPEVAFGNAADYLLRVAMGSEPRAGHSNKWRVLVLEDTGEMLTADAKDRVGQSLSRLLNLGDGLMGQGLNLLLLLTSNEPLSKIHPAVARPGRCAADIEFAPFSRDEAAKWLADHGAPDVAPPAGATLAELHGALEGRPLGSRTTVGFARA
jgi:hypothetical protein